MKPRTGPRWRGRSFSVSWRCTRRRPGPGRRCSCRPGVVPVRRRRRRAVVPNPSVLVRRRPQVGEREGELAVDRRSRPSEAVDEDVGVPACVGHPALDLAAVGRATVGGHMGSAVPVDVADGDPVFAGGVPVGVVDRSGQSRAVLVAGGRVVDAARDLLVGPDPAEAAERRGRSGRGAGRSPRSAAALPAGTRTLASRRAPAAQAAAFLTMFVCTDPPWIVVVLTSFGPVLKLALKCGCADS